MWSDLNHTESDQSEDFNAGLQDPSQGKKNKLTKFNDHIEWFPIVSTE